MRSAARVAKASSVWATRFGPVRSGVAELQGQGMKALMRIVLLTGLLSGAVPAAAQSQPSAVGEWAPLQVLPWRPVHSILMPTGKVLMYAHENSMAVWDPADNSLTTLPIFPYDPFCNGHTLTADGQLLMVGGTITLRVGQPFAGFIDPQTLAYSPIEK